MKQYRERVTVLKGNLFVRARLRLTALYLGILIVILSIFSIALYYSFSNNIDSAIEGEFEDNQTQERFVSNTLGQLRVFILIIDGCILGIVGGLSYFLAGMTLKPIQLTLEREEQFTSDVSHELRTPLTLMRTNLEVLLREESLELSDWQESAKSNLEEIKHMSNLVDQLLFLARAKEETNLVHHDVFSLSGLLKQTIESFNTYAKQKGVRLHDSIEDVYVYGDEQQIKRAIINVIKNAIDYNLPGGNVFISLNKEKRFSVIKIKDSGVGISSEHIPKIFERFYQVEKSRTRKEGSSGLGLSIVKKIISLHRGRIYVHSKSGQGTIFTILLPLV